MGGPVRRAARAVFWSAAGTIAATYIVVPAVILARGRLAPKRIAAGDALPDVTIVIAAFNEERSIRAKLDNLLALDYPAERRQILIASDGSTDGTNAIVAEYEDRGIRLLPLARVGKAAALNAALSEATGDVVVFSDANSMFVTGAIRAIVRPFADPTVGGVAGDQRYERGGAAGAMAEGERGYWDLDRMLKRAESAAGNVISATGAIYAVRRELVPPVEEGVTDDFITSTAVVAAGRRLVFSEDAAAYEPVASSGGVEYGRKVRVMTRGLRGVLLRRELLDPRRTGFYAIQMLWHKLLRRLMVFPLIALAISSPLLGRSGWLYRLATLGQAAFYGLAAVGIATRGRPISRSKLLALPAYFCLVNLAALHATLNVIRGRRIDRWEPQRSIDPDGPGGEEPAGDPSVRMSGSAPGDPTGAAHRTAVGGPDGTNGTARMNGADGTIDVSEAADAERVPVPARTAR